MIAASGSSGLLADLNAFQEKTIKSSLISTLFIVVIAAGAVIVLPLSHSNPIA